MHLTLVRNDSMTGLDYGNRGAERRIRALLLQTYFIEVRLEWCVRFATIQEILAGRRNRLPVAFVRHQDENRSQ